MSLKSKVSDPSANKYFYQTPNIVLSLGLSAGAFMLYSFFKSIAGEKGACWWSIEQMARHFSCSVNTIKKWKKELCLKREELQGLSLIIVKKRPKKNGTNQSDFINIVDIWPANMIYFSEIEPGSKIDPPLGQKLTPNNNPSKKGSLQNPSSPKKNLNASYRSQERKQQQKKKVDSDHVVVFSSEIEGNLLKLPEIKHRERQKIRSTYSDEQILKALRITFSEERPNYLKSFRAAIRDDWDEGVSLSAKQMKELKREKLNKLSAMMQDDYGLENYFTSTHMVFVRGDQIPLKLSIQEIASMAKDIAIKVKDN